MKVSKEVLKDIVKECLVEILSEGLASNQITERRVVAPDRLHERAPQTQQSQERRPSIYDKMSFVPQKVKTQTTAATKPMIPKKVNPLQAVNNITSDPVLASILAETASTGQHMHMGENTGKNTQPSHEEQVMSAGDAAARKMLMSDPTELFGESASMWSALAFPDKTRK